MAVFVPIAESSLLCDGVKCLDEIETCARLAGYLDPIYCVRNEFLNHDFRNIFPSASTVPAIVDPISSNTSSAPPVILNIHENNSIHLLLNMGMIFLLCFCLLFVAVFVLYRRHGSSAGMQELHIVHSPIDAILRSGPLLNASIIVGVDHVSGESGADELELQSITCLRTWAAVYFYDV